MAEGPEHLCLRCGTYISGLVGPHLVLRGGARSESVKENVSPVSPRPVWGSPADSDWGKIQDTGQLQQAQDYVQSVRVCTHVYDGCVCTVVRAADLCV